MENILRIESINFDNRKTKVNRKGVKNIINRLKNEPIKSNALKNEKVWVETFNSDITFRKEICSIIGILNFKNAKAYKINKKNLPYDRVKDTKIWKKLKEGTRETSPIPKADICIIYKDKNKVTISLKSGSGRLASGDFCECNASFFSVLQSNKIYEEDKTLKEYITKLIQLMKKLGKHNLTNYKNKKDIKTKLKKNPELENEDIIWYKKYKEVHEECMSIWDKLTKEYTVYIRDVLFECASGYNKFGVNIGRADWFIETENSTSTKIKEIFKLDKRNNELDKYLWSCMPITSSVLALKSSGRKLWQRLF